MPQPAAGFLHNAVNQGIDAIQPGIIDTGPATSGRRHCGIRFQHRAARPAGIDAGEYRKPRA